MYALASATVVHMVAQKCSNSKTKLSYCGCDQKILNQPLPDGEKWGGCSPDMDFSVNISKEFVDKRVDNEPLQYKSFVLHNNKIGRLVSIYNNYICS